MEMHTGITPDMQTNPVNNPCPGVRLIVQPDFQAHKRSENATGIPVPPGTGGMTGLQEKEGQQNQYGQSQ